MGIKITFNRENALKAQAERAKRKQVSIFTKIFGWFLVLVVAWVSSNQLAVALFFVKVEMFFLMPFYEFMWSLGFYI